MSPKVRFATVNEDSAGQRLDNFLLKTLKNTPKSLIYKIIRKGEVRVNKGRAKPDRKLQLGDLVRIPPVSLVEEKSVPFVGNRLMDLVQSAILFENDAFMVINKPSGLAVHGGSGINLGLIEVLRQLAQDEHKSKTMRELVHRLDKETSGCILIAKKRAMLTYLHGLLREDHQVEKTYHALVAGNWPEKRHVINVPLHKNELQSGERVVRVNLLGKPSETHFRILDRYTEATLVEARPITGRTHQIRVHAQHANHPLIGDEKYGIDDLNKKMKAIGIKRLFLHAFSLSFKLPDGDHFRVEAPLPDDLSLVLKNLN